MIVSREGYGPRLIVGELMFPPEKEIDPPKCSLGGP
jgi:hypothetical protein